MEYVTDAAVNENLDLVTIVLVLAALGNCNVKCRVYCLYFRLDIKILLHYVATCFLLVFSCLICVP